METQGEIIPYNVTESPIYNEKKIIGTVITITKKTKVLNELQRKKTLDAMRELQLQIEKMQNKQY